MSNEEDIEEFESKKDMAVLITTVDEFNNVSRFLHDDDVDQALAIVINLLGNPDIPAKQAVGAIIFLSALTVKCRIIAKNYMIIDKNKPDAAQKKNFYFTLADSMQELVNSLKYVIKL